MPTTTPNMGLSKPVTGPSGDVDAWGPYLNSDLDLLDLHSHEPGKGVPIKSASIRWDGDITAAYNGDPWALLGARALGLEPVAAATVASDRSVFYVDSGDSNNLYFKNEAGSDVRITNGGVLDVSLVGGIVGDYSTVGAEVAYSDADDAYTFKQPGSPRPWAYMRCGTVDIYEPAASITQRVRLQSPAALAASYAVTFPGALPVGTGKFLQLSTTGVLTANHTVSSPVTATDFRYTNSQSITLPAAAAVDITATHTRSTGAGSTAFNRWSIAASTNRIVWAVHLREGDHITGVAVWMAKNTSNANTVAARLWCTDGTTGVESPIGAGVSSSGNAPGFIVLAENGLSHDVTEDNEYYIVFSPGGGNVPAADTVFHATIAVTRP